ncbi:MAG: D-glycero-beta-D-manno-heptose 1,7-bisphosphate 7-phosphatase [Gammaproteobacteria bacterium]
MKLVVLDRDGVINRDSRDFIRSVGEWQPLPGSLRAIARLTRAGWTVVVATNQSGIARGHLSLDELERIHERMRAAAEGAGGRIDAVFFCPHGPADGCDCRKPAPGLFGQIEAHYGVSVKDVPAVGDSVRDVEAARAAGARPILVLTGNGLRAQAALQGERAPECYADLDAVSRALVGEEAG